jgi:uncharacterized protein YceK
MRRLIIAALFAFCVTVSGCASVTTSSIHYPIAAEQENSRTYNAPVDRVWDAAIYSIGKDFFVLDHIQKDSKIITLSFSIDNPATAIDCGEMTLTTTGGISGNGTQVLEYAQNNQRYMFGTGGMRAQPAMWMKRLDGKANIIITEEAKNKTSVIVNTRFIFSTVERYSRWIPTNGLGGGIYIPNTYNETITFNSGQSGFNPNGRIMCVSKYSFEKSILDKIAEGLEVKYGKKRATGK